jgi:hypothetical protein
VRLPESCRLLLLLHETEERQKEGGGMLLLLHETDVTSCLGWNARGCLLAAAAGYRRDRHANIYLSDIYNL